MNKFIFTALTLLIGLNYLAVSQEYTEKELEKDIARLGQDTSVVSILRKIHKQQQKQIKHLEKQAQQQQEKIKALESLITEKRHVI